MPTPFEAKRDAEREEAEETARSNSGWAARTDQPRRSVFANYRAAEGSVVADAGVVPAPAPALLAPESLDISLARAFLYQFLARAFEDPAPETWAWLTHANTLALVETAAQQVEFSPTRSSSTIAVAAAQMVALLRPGEFELYQSAYVTAFGHAARGDCPLNEIEYGDLKADPLFQPHRLADLAGFYRAFGLEVAHSADERPDHIGMELEFMSVLAAKEAYARQNKAAQHDLELCLDAQKKFLREHLGRWSPAFGRRLARSASHPSLAAVAEFLSVVIAAECARFKVTAGSEDLLLRPVDEANESLCASCGAPKK